MVKQPPTNACNALSSKEAKHFLPSNPQRSLKGIRFGQKNAAPFSRPCVRLGLQRSIIHQNTITFLLLLLYHLSSSLVSHVIIASSALCPLLSRSEASGRFPSPTSR